MTQKRGTEDTERDDRKKKIEIQMTQTGRGDETEWDDRKKQIELQIKQNRNYNIPEILIYFFALLRRRKK